MAETAITAGIELLQILPRGGGHAEAADVASIVTPEIHGVHGARHCQMSVADHPARRLAYRMVPGPAGAATKPVTSFTLTSRMI